MRLLNEYIWYTSFEATLYKIDNKSSKEDYLSYVIIERDLQTCNLKKTNLTCTIVLFQY